MKNMQESQQTSFWQYSLQKGKYLMGNAKYVHENNK